MHSHKMNLRLREYRKQAGLTLDQLGAKVGMSKGYLSDIENGKKDPSMAALRDIAYALSASASDLMDLKGDQVLRSDPDTTPPDGSVLIPAYDVWASAGHGALVTSEEIIDRLAFPPDYLRHITKANPRDLAIIGVKGDSMAVTLKDDDLVMIDTSKTELSFEGMFVVKIDGGAALLVKRIGRASRKGHINLISDNPAYPAVEIAVADVIPVGKVVWAGVKM